MEEIQEEITERMCRAQKLHQIHIAAGSSLTFAAFQLRSLGILPLGASNTITAAVTFVTAPGGDPNDFSSVRLACRYMKEAKFPPYSLLSYINITYTVIIYYHV
jgi:hypothetical protein